MEGSKIQLSLAEEELMNNAEIILTKNRVLQKMKSLLEEVQEKQQQFVENNNSLQENLFSIPPKISKGENYLGLPFLILDYPRVSTNEDFFFIRSMFWWGNFFSSTIQVGGKSKEKLQMNLKSKMQLLNERNYYIGINEDKWLHHFESSNYKKISLLNEMELNIICDKTDHIKIATYWPLSEWRQAANSLFESWKLLLELSN